MPEGQSYTLKELQIMFVTKFNRVSVKLGRGKHKGKVIIHRRNEKRCSTCFKMMSKRDRVKNGICQSCRYNEIIPTCGFCKKTNVKRKHNCVPALPIKYEKTAGGKSVQKVLCTECPPHMYYSYGAKGRHDERTHGKNMHYCDHDNCNAYFLDKLNLKQHKKIHCAPTHECPMCLMVFVHQSEKSNHMKTHTKVKRHAQWVNTTVNNSCNQVPLVSKINNEVSSVDQFLSLYQ